MPGLFKRFYRLILLVVLLNAGAQAQYQSFYPESLGEVREFHGPFIGFGFSSSPYYRLFQSEVAKGESAVPLLEELLTKGSPAARVYSGLALYSIDKRRGVEALESLKSDKRSITTFFYCSKGGGTVGDTAASALEAYRNGSKDFFLDSKPDEDERDFLWRQ